MQRYVLLTPGPATTSDTVKQAQVLPDVCPREQEFGEVMAEIAKKLTEIVASSADHRAVLFHGSGTAAVEAVISSVVPAAGKIVVINNGAYGERMVQIARTYGLDFIELKFSWDQAPDLQTIRATLAEHPVAVIAMVHHETTTGLLNPIAEVGKLARQVGAFFVVDAISSYAGIPLKMPEANIDFLVASSNKCLQGMPGCSFVISRNWSLEHIAEFPARSFYLNLYQQHRYFMQTRQMRFTPAVQCIYALKQALQELAEEGLEQRFARYQENWQILNQGMAELGFTRFLKQQPESGLLSTYLYPHEKFDFTQMHDLLKEKGFIIYPGKVGKEATFRLGNLGAITAEDIKNFLCAMRETLEKMGELR